MLKDRHSKGGIRHTQSCKTVLTSRCSSSPPSHPGGDWQIGSAWASVRTALYLLSPWQKHMVSCKHPHLDCPPLTITHDHKPTILHPYTYDSPTNICIIHASLKPCSHMRICLHRLSVNTTWALLFLLASSHVSLKPLFCFFTFSLCLLLCHSL